MRIKGTWSASASGFAKRMVEGESLEHFSIRLAEKWRIGRKGLDRISIAAALTAA